MPLDSEYELMQRLSAGNEDAFGELFGRYYPRVCAFVGCIVKEESTAEDIAQDIFLKIWERRDIFQGRVASFNGYVYRMARNAALNAIRQMTNIDWEQYIQNRSKRNTIPVKKSFSSGLSSAGCPNNAAGYSK